MSWLGLISGLVGAFNRFMDWFRNQQARADGAREAAAKQKEEQDAKRKKAQDAYDASLADNPDGLRDDRDLRD